MQHTLNSSHEGSASRGATAERSAARVAECVIDPKVTPVGLVYGAATAAESARKTVVMVAEKSTAVVVRLCASTFCSSVHTHMRE